MRKKLVATLTVVIVALGGLLAAYWLYTLPSSSSISVAGGIITEQTEDELFVWCNQPVVELTVEGFEGRVHLLNCVTDSDVTGAEGISVEGNTSMSFRTSGASAKITVTPREKDSFVFAVMGDNQGRNEILRTILQRLAGCEFAFLCGDLTPSGRASEFVPLQEALNCSPVPVYTTVGNHDVKTDGVTEYASRFGPTEYSFEYSGIRFVVVDSSDLNITAEQVDWMQDMLKGADRKVVLTHAPCYDPFEDNHTLFPDSCDRLLDFADVEGIDAVFTGHIHAFNHTVMEDTDFVITGGAGGALIDGEHHYVNVTVNSSHDLSYEKFDVVVNSSSQARITVTGKTGSTLNLTYDDLSSMALSEGSSSFENYFGNIGGEGTYSGVSVADLVDLVGGMEEGDILRVTSSDGYYQDFGYLNVYPDESWLELQGIMIISLSFDGVSVPDWEDGPKLVMLAPDGLYSNSDCEATSYEGQGFDIYPSAGSRWVKNAATIQVMP